MIYLFTLVTIFILFSYISIKFYNFIWNPVFLGMLPLVVGGIFAYFNSEWNQENIKDSVFWITLGIFVLFSFFLMIQFFKAYYHKKIFHKNSQIVYKYKNHSLSVCVNITILCTIVSIVLLIIEIRNITNNISEVFTNSTYIRYQYLARKSSVLFSIFGAFVALNFYSFLVLVPIALRENCKNIRIKFFLLICLRLLASLLSMSKELFIVDCIVFMSAYVLTLRTKRQELKFYCKYGLYFILLVMLLLVIVSFQRSYIGYRYNNYLEAVFGTVFRYIGIPIQSFGELLSVNNIQYTFGELVFRPVLNLLYYLGLHDRVSIVQDVIGNSSGNVYTFFGNLYRDFGYLGILFGSSVFGILAGLFYKYKNTGKFSSLVFNSIFLMVALFLFYDFKFMQTFYLATIFYASLINNILGKWLYENR